MAQAGDRRPARVRRRRGPGRFGRYIVNRGWAHLILPSGVGLFLFPFVWMLTTSLKTDKELTRPGSAEVVADVLQPVAALGFDALEVAGIMSDTGRRSSAVSGSTGLRCC